MKLSLGHEIRQAENSTILNSVLIVESHLETHDGFFQIVYKGEFDVYLL